MKDLENAWHYPDDLRYDLKDSGLTSGEINETLACAWEYTRCVVPEFTDWERYLAFIRIIAIGVAAEFRGEAVDVLAGEFLGYDVDGLLDRLFGATAVHEGMSREFKTFVLISSEKASGRRDSELFRRYADALISSPEAWFRLRDCDALARFSMAAAQTCNGIEDKWPSEEEYRVLAEFSVTMYDAVAHYKHRAEGELNSTFAYASPGLRGHAFRRSREILWALDANWATLRERRHILNFIRYFSGPIHMMMRRYRYVEDGLMIGKPEDEQVVEQTRRNIKLWYRNDHRPADGTEDQRYRATLSQADKIMFAGFAELLNRPAADKCSQCHRETSYGAREVGQFGGPKLCDPCASIWESHILRFPARASEILPLSPERLLTPSNPAAAQKPSGTATAGGGARKKSRYGVASRSRSGSIIRSRRSGET